MKTTSKFAKVLALVLCIAMLTLAFASCGKDKNVVLTYETELGTFTLTEAEYSLLMMIIKQNLFNSLTYGGYYYGSQYGIVDNADFWAQKNDEGKTYEQVYTENVLDIAKSVVIEKYLMKKYDLTLDDLANITGTTQVVDEKGKGVVDENGTPVYKTLKQEYDDAIAGIASAVKSLGGKGAYKRYYGYLPADLEKYYTFNYTSQLVMDYKYKNDTPLTDDELNKYYEDNFKQYIIILINKEEDIKYEKDKDGKYVLDANGNKKPYYVVYDESGTKKYTTDISEDALEKNKYTLAYAYQYEKIDDIYKDDKAQADARKAAKKELAAEIFAKLEAGTSFEELAALYSDEMLTHYYKDGYMVDGDLISNDVAIKAIKDLEVGEYTKESFTVDTKYEYIIKRVDLTEKAYKHAEENAEVDTYADLFENYEDAVTTVKYSEYLEEMAKEITVDTGITSKYTMKDTYLSKMFGN